jgi:HAD superfamily hydrolase (TIGR01509 family)
MTKAIIFDLDGVLVDSKETHFNALNLALSDYDPKYVISKTEQEHVYEGMTTKSKLDVLTMKKGLPTSAYSDIWKSKQRYTAKLFHGIGIDQELIVLLNIIKSQGIKIGVASNSIRETLDTCLSNLGILKLIDVSLSNEDVTKPKPNPEIYLSCMEALGATADATVIYEDSDIGQEAARSSGGHLIPVYNRSGINLITIHEGIDYLAKH